MDKRIAKMHLSNLSKHMILVKVVTSNLEKRLLPMPRINDCIWIVFYPNLVGVMKMRIERGRLSLNWSRMEDPICCRWILMPCKLAIKVILNYQEMIKHKKVWCQIKWSSWKAKSTMNPLTRRKISRQTIMQSLIISWMPAAHLIVRAQIISPCLVNSRHRQTQPIRQHKLFRVTCQNQLFFRAN